MKLKNLTLSGLCAVTLAFTMSCNSNNGEEVIVITDFPQPMTLDEKIINLDSAMYLMPGMYQTGDYFFLRNDRKMPDEYTLYDKNFKYIGPLLSKGEGPDQVLSGIYFNQWSGNKQNPEILIFDSKKNRLSKLNIAPFNGLTTVLDLPASVSLSPFSIYYLNDTTYVGVNLEVGKSCDIFTYNPINQNVNYISNDLKFDPQFGYYTSQNGLFIDSDNDRIIQYYKLIPWIYIYDTNFNLQRRIALYNEVDPEPLNNGTIGILQLHAIGDDMICLIGDYSHGPSTLATMVINIDGTVKSFIETTDTYNFIVDAENDRLFLVCYDEDKEEVFLRETSLSSIL